MGDVAGHGVADLAVRAAHVGVEHVDVAVRAAPQCGDRAHEIDSLAGDLAASPDNVRLQNATIRRGTLSAQFQAAVGLQEWKTSDSSQVPAQTPAITRCSGSRCRTGLAVVVPASLAIPACIIAGR